MKKSEKTASKQGLNKIRAAVLGANDGIVSTAAVVMGAAGATDNSTAIITAGFAALVAGAFSMAVGEYVSVSSQSDAETTYIDRKRQHIEDNPDAQIKALADAYERRGMSAEIAKKAAKQVSEKDALGAHLETGAGVAEEDVSSPSAAALSSFLSFIVGGSIPFAACIMTTNDVRIAVTMIATVIALGLTGVVSSYVTGTASGRATVRIICGGLIAMAATYAIGSAFGVVIN